MNDRYQYEAVISRVDARLRLQERRRQRREARLYPVLWCLVIAAWVALVLLVGWNP